jgi:hypothetical protein
LTPYPIRFTVSFFIEAVAEVRVPDSLDAPPFTGAGSAALPVPEEEVRGPTTRPPALLIR